ncbi:hypothetical protein HPP92_022637 [Vanilla planifolia]|uniref:Uncharacterized protein n=1 Tax=Vanilla planifolia TaxID=51239 RepID=A0A835UDT8_VANPL|nr:hypothetical protein HPP92_022637 [Vanilla planifolia]
MQLTFSSPSQGGMCPDKNEALHNLNLSKQPKVFESEKSQSSKAHDQDTNPQAHAGLVTPDHSWLNASKFEGSKQTPRTAHEPDGSFQAGSLARLWAQSEVRYHLPEGFSPPDAELIGWIHSAMEEVQWARPVKG